MSHLLTTFSPTDTLLRSFFARTEGDGEAPTTRLRPRVDIHEHDDRFEIRADLPGVRKEDLQVDVDKGELILKATRRDSDERKSSAIRRERHLDVQYLRSFSLGDAVDGDQVAGELRDGVLTLTLPKRETALPRRIEVQ